MAQKRGNGEGSIIKLATGKYKATITVGVSHDSDENKAKQVRKAFTHEKKSEVQKWLNEQINLKNKDSLIFPSKTTLLDWLTKWLEKYKKNNLREKTYEDYKNIITKHIAPIIGDMKIQDLKTEDLQELYSRKLKTNLSARSIEYIHAVIRGALKQAVEEGIIYKNVSSFCVLPKKHKKEISTLTEKQIHKLLITNKDQRLYALLLLELGTGLRRSEILALHWKNIDFERKILTVEGSIAESREKGVFFQPTTKSKSSNRTILLPETIIGELQRYKTIQESTTPEDIVFKNRKGGYIRPSTLSYMFRYTWLKNAGLPHTRFHDLRHTHATQLLAMGIHAKIIQLRLGHSNISTTLDIYTHSTDTLQQDAVNKFDDILQMNTPKTHKK